MRLDKYLKVSRLIKRRTIANEACDNGRISVNGRVVKASYDVKVGDKIEIALGSRTLAVEVLAVAEAVRKEQAAQAKAAPAAAGYTVQGEGDPAIDAQVMARYEAKKAKNFAEADRIRDELKAQGIEITDVPGGAVWKRS